MTSPPAATGNALSAIQEILHAQVDIIAHATAGNFDAVREGGEGGMSPTRPAILGDVLVELVSQAAFTVDVVPVPLFGQILMGQVAVEYAGRAWVRSKVRP